MNRTADQDRNTVRGSEFQTRCRTLLTSVALSALLSGLPAQAQLAGMESDEEANRPLELAADSPYHDPTVIYLEADELINEAGGDVLTASGSVEGRYQDRTLRADKVIYNLKTGRVIAAGNVVLVDTNGSSQYADKLELSNELEAGTAANFTSRFPNGAVSGAAFATRESDGGVSLYNAYYTACEACEGENPSWQLKARRVSQDKERNLIKYRDAVFEFKGIPVFYTPYMAHPDPTAGRTSGWLSPFGGWSNSKGLNGRVPYYWAIDPYSEMTFTPRVYQKVNPLLEYAYKRRFHSGDLEIDGSLTYGSVFDRNGDPFINAANFSDPSLAPLGKRLRSHIDARGLFDINPTWQWGFTAQGASDDLYLNRYDLNEQPDKFGLYDGDSRRLVSQAFVVGQDDDFRFSTAAYGFQSLRTTIREDNANPGQYFITAEDDSTLPIVAPKIELTKFFTDPIVGGRLKAFGDVTHLSRKVGTDYTRATGGLDWSKTFIMPGGIEAKPFAGARFDYFDIAPDNAADIDFDRALGQVGLDMRWPFINAGDTFSVIVEPRAMLTQNFGDGKLSNFSTLNNNGQTVSLYQDSLDIDLDHNLLWSPNKSTGYDFWQEGFRADVGGSVSALWGENNRAALFVGQSFASDTTGAFTNTSGLAQDTSDLVGLLELDLGKNFKFDTRLRYDDDNNKFRRLDTGFSYNTKLFNTRMRYYKIDSGSLALLTNPEAPAEEISGSLGVNLHKNWGARYTAYRDLDRDLTRRQELALIYRDGCTLIEFYYDENNFVDDAVRNTNGFGVRVSLLTIGEYTPE